MKAINATTIGNLIGYKIGGSFEDYSDNGDIGFEILFPHVYASYEEAQYNNKRGACPVVKCNLPEIQLTDMISVHDLKDYGDCDEEIMA